MDNIHLIANVSSILLRLTLNLQCVLLKVEWCHEMRELFTFLLCTNTFLTSDIHQTCRQKGDRGMLSMILHFFAAGNSDSMGYAMQVTLGNVVI